MAITQGINGTFAPLNDYEEPIYFRIFKKTVSVGKLWEDRVFYEIKQFPMGRNTTEKWLSEKYGQFKYADTWWTTVNGVCMNEKIYLHYKLME